jgi:hypothetical protein
MLYPLSYEDGTSARNSASGSARKSSLSLGPAQSIAVSRNGEEVA